MNGLGYCLKVQLLIGVYDFKFFSWPGLASATLKTTHISIYFRVLGNHDKPRVGSRYGTERVDGMLMLLLLLPGVAVTYNGDEIGMLDFRYGISWEDTVDPQV